jgi:CBS domain-containing protein
MKVRDAMRRHAFSVHPNTTLSAISETMRVHDIGAIPILEDHILAGIITDRDIVVRAFFNGFNPTEVMVRDIMTKKVISCCEDENLQYALKIMEKNKIRRLPVLDETNFLLGMLSLGDVAHVASSQLMASALMKISEHHGKNHIAL